MSIGEQGHVFGPGQNVSGETGCVPAVCEHGHSFVFDLITIAIGAVKHTRTIKLAEPRTVWRQIPQTSSKQQSPRLKNPFTGKHSKAFRRDFLDPRYARLDDQPTVVRHFIAASGKEFARIDPVVAEKAVHAMRVFIPRTVVMKRECPAKIAREEERRRQARRPRADDDAVVGLILER